MFWSSSSFPYIPNDRSRMTDQASKKDSPRPKLVNLRAACLSYPKRWSRRWTCTRYTTRTSKKILLGRTKQVMETSAFFGVVPKRFFVRSVWSPIWSSSSSSFCSTCLKKGQSWWFRSCACTTYVVRVCANMEKGLFIYFYYGCMRPCGIHSAEKLSIKFSVLLLLFWIFLLDPWCPLFVLCAWSAFALFQPDF